MTIPPFARSILQGLVIFAFLILAVLFTSSAINFRYRCKAERLLQDIQSLRVGQSTTAEVQRIMSRNGGGPSQSSASFCTPMDGAYGAGAGSQAIGRLEQSVPVLKRFGLRPWATRATVVLRGGRVCYLSYEVMMQDPNGGRDWLVRSEFLPERVIDVSEPQHRGYRTSTRDIRNLRILESEVTPEATEEERQEAFTYDLSCVTSLRGCRGRCQIAPLVWRKVYRESFNAGWTMPTEETSDPQCKFAESRQ